MELIVATHNHNKLIEIQDLMPKHIKLLSLTDIGLNQDIPETASTISGNAIQKMNYVAQRYQLPVFADDTGLEVTALDGEPGVLSARYAGNHKDSKDNIQLLLANLQNKSDRSARFVTAIALYLDNKQHVFKGICTGTITNKEHGQQGFGYDPIFKPDGYDITFAQMSNKEKGKISHRGKAIQQLISFLN